MTAVTTTGWLNGKFIDELTTSTEVKVGGGLDMRHARRYAEEKAVREMEEYLGVEEGALHGGVVETYVRVTYTRRR